MQDVCQYEDKKAKNKAKDIYFFDTRNQKSITRFKNRSSDCMMTPTDESMFSMIGIPQIDSQSTSGEWGRYVEFVFLGKDGVITVEMCYIKNKELNILEVYEKNLQDCFLSFQCQYIRDIAFWSSDSMTDLSIACFSAHTCYKI